jgi:hypothetical protein
VHTASKSRGPDAGARYRKLEQYSLGMVQRLKLAATLVHPSKINGAQRNSDAPKDWKRGQTPVEEPA